MTRRFLVIILFLGGLPGWTQTLPTAPAKPKVVFVCEHGSAKSMIAAAEFRRLAKQNGLEVSVISRGTTPDVELPKWIREGLASDGYDVSQLKPRKVSEADLRNAAKIVSFGPDLKQWLPQGAAVIDWSATPSVSGNYAVLRDYIREQAAALLKSLQK